MNPGLLAGVSREQLGLLPRTRDGQDAYVY